MRLHEFIPACAYITHSHKCVEFILRIPRSSSIHLLLGCLIYLLPAAPNLPLKHLSSVQRVWSALTEPGKWTSSPWRPQLAGCTKLRAEQTGRCFSIREVPVMPKRIGRWHCITPYESSCLGGWGDCRIPPVNELSLLSSCLAPTVPQETAGWPSCACVSVCTCAPIVLDCS